MILFQPQFWDIFKNTIILNTFKHLFLCILNIISKRMLSYFLNNFFMYSNMFIFLRQIDELKFYLIIFNNIYYFIVLILNPLVICIKFFCNGKS